MGSKNDVVKFLSFIPPPSSVFLCYISYMIGTRCHACSFQHSMSLSISWMGFLNLVGKTATIDPCWVITPCTFFKTFLRRTLITSVWVVYQQLNQSLWPHGLDHLIRVNHRTQSLAGGVRQNSSQLRGMDFREESGISSLGVSAERTVIQESRGNAQYIRYPITDSTCVASLFLLQGLESSFIPQQ